MSGRLLFRFAADFLARESQECVSLMICEREDFGLSCRYEFFVFNPL